MDKESMYEICKEQYKRKVLNGRLTHEYIEKNKVYLGIFLMNEMLTQDQYQEIMDYLKDNDPENKIDTDSSENKTTTDNSEAKTDAAV